MRINRPGKKKDDSFLSTVPLVLTFILIKDPSDPLTELVTSVKLSGLGLTDNWSPGSEGSGGGTLSNLNSYMTSVGLPVKLGAMQERAVPFSTVQGY